MKKKYLYGWCTELVDVCDLLTQPGKFEDIEPEEVHMIHSFKRYGQKQGYLTARQMSSLGFLSKKYIQKGEYVKGDWWDGAIQQIKLGYQDIKHIDSTDEVVTAFDFRSRFIAKMDK